MKVKKMYANTNKQDLVHHLFAVGFLSSVLINRYTNDDKLSKAVFVAGCLHDLGKIDPEFQRWIEKNKKKERNNILEDGEHIERGKFSFEKHPRHNEISLLLYKLLDDKDYKKINSMNKKIIEHSILWHHSKPNRKEEFKQLGVIYNKFKDTLKDKSLCVQFQQIDEIIKLVDNLSKEYGLSLDSLLKLKKPTDELLREIKDSEINKFKNYRDYSAESNDDAIDNYIKDVLMNAKCDLARSVIISTDRLVSAIGGSELKKHIEDSTLSKLLDDDMLMQSSLIDKIKICLQKFNDKYPGSNRNIKQKEIALQLSNEEGVSVLSGPAGCGKTKIALEWALNTDAKRIIWICPRVSICQGLINDLTSGEYLPDAKIEIFTGEFKNTYQNGNVIDTPENQEFSGDVIITTIDQIINTVTTHSRVTKLIQYMDCHVVFDEFHEYVNMAALNLLFAELIECKKMQGLSANTLLVSATPNFYFVENILGLDSDGVINMESFNESWFKLKFKTYDETEKDEFNPFYKSQKDNTFVISNTAITAQKSFIKNQENENAILLHSKYKKSDKRDLFNKVFDSFKYNGQKEYEILRAGPIVQASLNISCDNMITDFTTAENYLQRLGRLNRFGENKESAYTTAIPQTLFDGKNNGSVASFLNYLHSLKSARAWFEFLKDNLSDKSVKISDIYKIYQDFYQNDKCVESVEQDLLKAFKESVGIINNKVLDPVAFKTKDNKIKISKRALRGDDRFVQLAVLSINNGKYDFRNEYICDIEDNLTMPIDTIRGHGDSVKNLVAFMVKKHHNIKENVKKPYKDYILENRARRPESPIYLSYTPEDLLKVGAEPHEHGIYYAITKKQPIGAVCFSKL